MNQLSHAHAELLLFVDHVEHESAAVAGGHPQQLEDMRAEAFGALSMTLDRIEQGLGRRLLDALYPEHRKFGGPCARSVPSDALSDTAASSEVL